MQLAMIPFLATTSVTEHPTGGVSAKGADANAGNAFADWIRWAGTTSQPAEAASGTDVLKLLDALLTLRLGRIVHTEADGALREAFAAEAELSELLSESPEQLEAMLDNLLQNGEVLQLLAKVQALLMQQSAEQTAAQPLPGQRPEQAEQAAVPAAEAPNPQIGKAEAARLISGLLEAMRQEPDSVLYKQLAEQFSQLIRQALAQQTSSVPAQEAADESVQGDAARQGLMRSAITHDGQAVMNRPANVDVQTASRPAASDAGSSGFSPAALTVQTGQPKAMPSAMLTGQNSAGAMFAESAKPMPVQHALAALDMLAAKSGVTESYRILHQTAADPSPLNAEPQLSAEAQPQPMSVVQHETPRFWNAAEPAHMPVMRRVPADQFVQIAARLTTSVFQTNTADGTAEARLILQPEHLGQVEVKLTMQSGQLIAQFATQTLLGKEMLESQMAQLRTALQSQGYQVERIEVSQLNSSQSGLFQDSREQPSFSGQFGQGNNRGFGGFYAEDADADWLNADELLSDIGLYGNEELDELPHADGEYDGIDVKA